TGKATIPPARPQPVPTGKPKVFEPVPAGRQNRPFPVPTDRGYSPLVSSSWWKSTARPMPYFSRPTSSLFQTYTPYVPTMSYNHMKYGRDRWATAIKPSAGRPIFHRFAKADSMKVVPPPLSEDYTSLSDHSNLDESQMSYEVNTNDFASSDSSVKYLEPKPNDSTSCASTSSVSTSENEAEIESNVGTYI
nr:hypothetical protein CTI12_AA237220 [Tanacetum cinerariifolium]